MNAYALVLMRLMMKSDNGIQLILTDEGLVVTDQETEGIVIDKIENNELLGV